jgi:hypothetical protein
LASDRHFGVPLDFLAEISGQNVPKILSEGLQQLDKGNFDSIMQGSLF